MKILIFSIIYLFTSFSVAQNDKISTKEVSCPEKWWAVKHPFALKKAKKVTIETKKIVNQLKKDTILRGNGNGGQIDAFRHAYWMARLTQEIGHKRAKRLGTAHEKGNYKAFKKGKEEDGDVPDKISSDMDFFNNEVGIEIGKNSSVEVTKEAVINAVLNGECKVIKMNKQGTFLTCEGEIIPKETLIGKWENNKCLVSSD
ncbi:MAG: hypothetical protein VR77_07105 [Flavobacteriales bacterium BRH_c54]|nr:MAG: hypothetical protein VR77_07105 [Flavobacteriales bacterium BRH_c54]